MQRSELRIAPTSTLATGFFQRPVLLCDVLDRVSAGREPVTAAPGELLPPVVDRARRRLGGTTSDEELLLSLLFMPRDVDALRAAGPIRRQDTRGGLVELVRQVARHRDVTTFVMSHGTSSS